MYTSECLVQRIKNQAKNKGILIKSMLQDCDLSINTLNQITDKKGLSSVSLAKIADYLGCSVDYLLGRTEEPQVESVVVLEPEEYPVIVKYRGITEQGRAAVDKLLDELHKQKDAPTAYSDERIEAILKTRPELTELANQIRTLDREQTLRAIDYIQYLRSQQDKN